MSYMDPYHKYLSILAGDVLYHDYTVDGNSWPPSVQECSIRLQNAFKLPKWIRNGPYPFVEPRAQPLLEVLQHPADDEESDVCDDTDDCCAELRRVFNLVLTDCLLLRKVLAADRVYGAPNPKESFLAIAVRTAMWTTHPTFFINEETPVALPRHASGELSGLFHRMRLSATTTLLVSIPIQIFQESHQPRSSSDGQSSIASSSDAVTSVRAGLHLEKIKSESSRSASDSDSGSREPLSHDRPPTITVSAWLNGAGQKYEQEEESEDDKPEEDQRQRNELDAHVLDFVRTQRLPTVAGIPVLCMADEKTLPAIMTSVLYHRYALHIDEPVVGISFDRYDTCLSFYFGWTDSVVAPGNILPRVHLGCLDDLRPIDMASPSSALSVAQFLLSLETHFERIRNDIDTVRGTLVEDMQAARLQRWRIDSCIAAERCDIELTIKERIVSWLDGLVDYDNDSKLCEMDASMSKTERERRVNPSHRAKKTLSQDDSLSRQIEGPLASKVDLEPAATRRQYPSVTGKAIGTKSSEKAMSYSDFCGGSAIDAEERTMEWLFDRNVMATSFLCDAEMYNICGDMMSFIWPTEWDTIENIPPVDANVQELVPELKSVAKLWKKTQDANPVRFPPASDDDAGLRALQLMKGSLSAILQACVSAQSKVEPKGSVNETTWHHDMDRLLFKFLNDAMGDSGLLYHDRVTGTDKPVSRGAHSRHSPERTLQMPLSRVASLSATEARSVMRIMPTAIEDAYNLQAYTEVHQWSNSDWQKHERATLEFVGQLAYRWSRHTTQSERMHRLEQGPNQGRCDTLGTIYISLSIRNEKIDRYRFSKSIPHSQPYEERATILRTVHEEDERPASNSDIQARDTGRPRSVTKYSARSSGQSDTSPSRREGDVFATADHESRVISDKEALATSSESTTHDDSASALEKNLGKLGLIEDDSSNRSKDSQDQESSSIFELPLLVVNHNKGSATVQNQHRLCCTAAARFLEAVGITKHPVFSIITDGPLALLAMASVKDERVYIYERHTQSFDISIPIGAWHYASVLARIAVVWGPRLAERFEKVKDEFIARVERDDPSLRWTKEEQMKDLS